MLVNTEQIEKGYFTAFALIAFDDKDLQAGKHNTQTLLPNGHTSKSLSACYYKPDKTLPVADETHNPSGQIYYMDIMETSKR